MKTLNEIKKLLAEHMGPGAQGVGRKKSLLED